MPCRPTVTASPSLVSCTICSVLAALSSQDWTTGLICASVSDSVAATCESVAEVVWNQRTWTATRGPSTPASACARLVVDGGGTDPATSTVTSVPVMSAPVSVSEG